MIIIEAFFNPRSVAIIGASRSPTKIGHVILKNFVSYGYKGRIFPINPNADKILGIQCYKSILDIKEKIDLAVIVIPASISIKAVEECIKKKIKSLIMVTGGFSEIGNVETEKKIGEIIKKNKVRLIGPNCLGVLDLYSNVDTFFLPRSRMARPRPGNISIITQSGGVGSSIPDIMAKENFGVSKIISYGNGLDIKESDLLEYLNKDPTTKVICLYIEGIKDGKKFMEVSKKVSKVKPIVAIKGGITEEGSKAVISHTASIAGSSEIYTAAFKQTGIVEVDSYETLFNAANTLANSPKPSSNKVQIITNAGGVGILCIDSVIKNNLRSASLSKSSFNVLKSKLKPIASINNPIDLTGNASTEDYLVAIETCLKEKDIGILLIALMMQVPTVSPDIINLIGDIHKKSKKPIIITSPGGTYSEIHRRHLQILGVPAYNYPDEAVKSIKALCDYYKIK
ncbi:MAG: CoA-binding protein [Nanoarchaeota archaeon]|mgnify:FL=1